MFSAIHQTSWSWTAAYHYVPVPPLSRTLTRCPQTAASRLQQLPVTARSQLRGARDGSQAQSVVAVTVQTVDAGARDVNCRVGGPVHGHGRVPLSGGLRAGRTTTQTCSLRHRRSTSTSVVTNAVTTSQVVHLGRTRPGGHCSATPIRVNFDFITRAVQGISGSTLTSFSR